MVQTEQIVALLIAEHDRLSQAIDALQGPQRTRRPSSARTPPAVTAAAKKTAPKRRISAAGRKAIAEGARRRWAAIRAAKANPKKTAAKSLASVSAAKPAPKKRRIGAAGRRAMADAAKRRWAAAKAAKSEPASKKETAAEGA